MKCQSCGGVEPASETLEWIFKVFWVCAGLPLSILGVYDQVEGKGRGGTFAVLSLSCVLACAVVCLACFAVDHYRKAENFQAESEDIGCGRPM